MDSFRVLCCCFFSVKNKQIWDHSASLSPSRAWISHTSFHQGVRARSPISHGRNFSLFSGDLFILSLRDCLLFLWLMDLSRNLTCLEFCSRTPSRYNMKSKASILMILVGKSYNFKSLVSQTLE